MVPTLIERQIDRLTHWHIRLEMTMMACTLSSGHHNLSFLVAPRMSEGSPKS